MPATLAAIPAILAATSLPAGVTAVSGGLAVSFAGAGGGALFAGATTLGAIGTIGTFTAAGIGAGLLGTVSSIALSTVGNLAMKALAGGAPGISSQAQQATFSEPEQERFFYFGRVMTGGALAFVDEGKEDGDLYRAIITDCGEQDAVEEHRLNNEPLTLDGDGWVTAPDKWAGNVQLRTRLGTADQAAYQELIDAFPGIWTPQHRLRGLAGALILQKPVATSEVLDTYPNGARGETYTQVRRAAKDIYDPRTETSGWTRNAALIVLWALTHPWFGNLSLDDFNLDPDQPFNWLAAADECDLEVENGDGTLQPQWTLSGRIQVPPPGRQATTIVGTIADMLASFDAEIFDDPAADGKLSIRIGAPEPIEDGPLTTDHILAWEDQDEPGLLDGHDAIRIKYIEPRLSYTEKLTPTFGTDTPQSILVVPRLMIDNWDQAQRIARRAYLRMFAAATAKASTNLAGILLPVGSAAAIALPIRDAGEVWRVTDREVSLGGGQGGVQLSLELVDPDHNTDPARVPLQLPPILDGEGGIVAAPQGVRAAADVADDGTVRVVWDRIDADADQQPAGVSAELEWSETGAGVWTGTVEVADARARAGLLDASAAGGLIDVRIRFATTSGQTSWTEVAGIDPAAPLAAQAAPATTPGTWETAEDEGTDFTVDPAGADTWKVTVHADNGVWQELVPAAADADGVHAFYPARQPGGAADEPSSATVTNVSGAVSAAAAVTITFGGGGGGE